MSGREHLNHGAMYIVYEIWFSVWISAAGACTGPGEHRRPVARHIRRRLWPEFYEYKEIAVLRPHFRKNERF